MDCSNALSRCLATQERINARRALAHARGFEVLRDYGKPREARTAHRNCDKHPRWRDYRGNWERLPSIVASGRMPPPPFRRHGLASSLGSGGAGSAAGLEDVVARGEFFDLDNRLCRFRAASLARSASRALSDAARRWRRFRAASCFRFSSSLRWRAASSSAVGSESLLATASLVEAAAGSAPLVC